MIVRGTNKGREGKVTSVYRLKYCIHINGGSFLRDKISRLVADMQKSSARRAAVKPSQSPLPPPRSSLLSLGSTRYGEEADKCYMVLTCSRTESRS
jgi:hypothetical protein